MNHIQTTNAILVTRSINYKRPLNFISPTKKPKDYKRKSLCMAMKYGVDYIL